MTPQECRRFGQNLLLPTPMVELVGDDTVTSAATLTATSPRLLRLDATGGAFQITLPAAPYEAMTFLFSEDVGSTNAVTLDGNGKTINGSATLVMNAAYRQRMLRYNGTQWIVIGGIG